MAFPQVINIPQTTIHKDTQHSKGSKVYTRLRCIKNTMFAMRFNILSCYVIGIVIYLIFLFCIGSWLKEDNEKDTFGHYEELESLDP